MLDGVTWFDTDDFGVVDRIDSESIVTAFYTVILPVWPEHSAYVSRDDDGVQRRIAIPLQRRSVILGYLRAPTWLAALILGLPSFLVPGLHWLAVPALLLAIAAGLLQFVAGRIDDHERFRRELLRRVVGLGAPPELLPEDLRDELRAHLVNQWNARSPYRKWADAINHGEAHELLVAIADYHQDRFLVNRARANYQHKMWN